MPRQIHSLLAATMLLALPAAVRADIVLSSNDGHTVQDDQKRLVAPKQMHPDTISVIDVARYPPRITATVEVPGSVVGPPTAAGWRRTKPGRSLHQRPRPTRRRRTA